METSEAGKDDVNKESPDTKTDDHENKVGEQEGVEENERDSAAKEEPIEKSVENIQQEAQGTLS